MKKATLKAIKSLLFICVLTVALLCSRSSNTNRWEESKMPNPEITSISIHYGGGMEFDKDYCYSVSRNGDEYNLYVALNSRNIQIEKDISKQEYDEFLRPFDSVDMTSWDEGDDDNRGMPLDASTLSFIAYFSDGTTCKVRSLFKFPEDCQEAVDAFISLFEPTIEEAETTDQ